MSYRLINANALNGVISNDDYEKVLNAPCIFADLPNGLDGEHYNLQESTTKNDLGVDCVARQDVERYIEGFINEYTPTEELEFINLELDGLKHLPPATPQEPRWISVGERLPEPNANDGLIARYYLIQNEYEDMLVARYDGIGWEQMYQHEYLEDDVTAWMPLPAPYEPQESEDEK